MKKIKLLALMAITMTLFASCSEKGTEETKMIPSSAVKTSGTHSDLLSVAADSVKIMLVNIGEDRWEVRAVIPLTNEYAWEDVPGTDRSASSYFEPRMGNLEIEFLDANGSPLKLRLKTDYDVVASILSSNKEKTEDLVVAEFYGGDYKNKKPLFDKVAGISLKQMDLSRVYSSSSSSNSTSSSSSDSDSDDDDDDDWDDVEKAAKASKSAYKAAKAAYKAAKEIEDDDWDW